MATLTRALAFGVLIVLAACDRQAHLYPANDVATPSGVITLDFVSRGTGAGPVKILMPSGELMQGEYSTVRGGAVGFGSVFATVYGPRGTTSGSASGASYVVPGGSPGMASLFGDRGTSMQCEYYNDNFSGHGYGACRASNGALWRLQY